MEKGVYMTTIELNENELNMVNEALWFYLSKNDSFNADIIINIMDKIEEALYE
jgi:hypothetical protein